MKTCPKTEFIHSSTIDFVNTKRKTLTKSTQFIFVKVSKNSKYTYLYMTWLI
jgi:hypothetical protein